MSPDYKALCAEMLTDYDNCHYRSELSEIIPSEDLGSYQLFLKFASLEELEGNYVLNITLKKIEDYESQRTLHQ
jgi:hypothetical protein